MKTILFAEDEPNLQLILSDVLKGAGYNMLKALDGEAALKILKTEPVDLVLLDLIMPKKDGFEVLQEMKADDNMKNIPVIVLTNLEGSSDVEKALSLGATTYLVKANYKLDEVVDKVKKFLEKT